MGAIARVMLWCALLQMTFCGMLRAADVKSDENGYSITIPDDWEEISYTELGQLTHGRQGMFGFENGFKKKGAAAGAFPIVLVNAKKYPGSKPSEAELNRIAREFADELNKPKTPLSAVSVVGRVFNTARSSDATIDAKTKTFTWTIELDSRQLGVNGSCKGHFGSKAVVTIFCFAERSTFASHQAQF